MKNRHYFPIVAAMVPLALATSLGVHAQSADGYLNDDTPLYAGPAPEYPQIEGLPYGTYVTVQGCTQGWEWCDVVSQQGDWGWVPGDYIDYMYQDQPVVLTEYGPRIGIPIVSFSITSYWNAHYRNRPFYGERESWYHRDIPHRAPAPPHHAADRGPPPPPPGGWHHGGHSSQTSHGNAPPTHYGSESQSHHGSESSQSHYGEATQAHHGSESQAPRHENAPEQSYHQNPPSPPRVPANEPQHPQGDHHANVPQPMGAPPHAVPPHNSHVPPPPHSSSSTDHGKQPQQPKKKDDHDNGDDNGH